MLNDSALRDTNSSSDLISLVSGVVHNSSQVTTLGRQGDRESAELVDTGRLYLKFQDHKISSCIDETLAFEGEKDFCLVLGEARGHAMLCAKFEQLASDNARVTYKVVRGVTLQATASSIHVGLRKPCWPSDTCCLFVKTGKFLMVGQKAQKSIGMREVRAS